MFDLAIIGAGATAISLLKQLQDEISAAELPSPSIAILCPVECFARGKAFGDADSIFKVNTPPHMLGISEHEPDGFERWMISRYNNLDLYPNRLVYADFLSETYLNIFNAKILHISEFHINVASIVPFMDGYKLTTEKNGIVAAKKVVMCLGSLHGSSFPDLEMQIGYKDHHSQIVDLPEGPVLVAGSGLTAVDFARLLCRNGNREVHLFSRHGYAPTCSTSKSNYIPIRLTFENLFSKDLGKIRLSHFMDLLAQECDLLPGGGEIEPALNILRKQGVAHYFDYLMSRSGAGDLPYQDLLISTRPYMHDLWQALSLEDKALFSTRYGSAWAAWRHPIPYEVMSELTELAREGRLHFHKSSWVPVYENEAFNVKTDDGRLIKSDYFIDGTGGSNSLESIDSPLLKNLSRINLIESHPCGGINTNPLTYNCMTNGVQVQNLYNIGPLSKGSLFSTNAFWFNARCAGQWARQYVMEIVHKNLSAA